MGVLGEVASSILLFCLVFGMSATVEMKSLRKQVQNRVALCIGVALQFIILPFVGFVVVKVLNMPSTTGVILLVVTSSPGGSYSNWWCSLFNAELALSVTMTTISTLLSVVMLPTNLVLYTRWTYSADVVKSLDWSGLIVSLVVVISGIGGGLYASYRAEQRGNKARFHKTANRLGNVAGLLLVTLSVFVSSTGNGDHSKASLWDQDAKFYIGVALPAILGLAIAVKLASHYDLEKPERVAVAVEACYQNTGIATSVALTLYSGDELSTAIGVPLYYGIVEAVVLALFCLVCWKIGWTKAPPSDNICKVIMNSYEVDEEEEQEGDPTEGETDAEEPPTGVVRSEQHGKNAVGAAGTSPNNLQIASGAAVIDEQSDEFVVSGHKRIPSQDPGSIVGADVEMTPQQSALSPAPATVVDSGDGSVAVLRTDGHEHDIDEEAALPQPSRMERFMATMRARAAGYGTGQQNEDRGLRRPSRGPVTLGLSHVATPDSNGTNKKTMRKKDSNNDNDNNESSSAAAAAGATRDLPSVD